MGRGSAKKVKYNGIVFDSNAEYLFYLELLEKEKKGEVQDIGVHIPFELIPKFKTKSGNYRLDIDLAFGKGLDFDTIIGNTKQLKF